MRLITIIAGLFLTAPVFAAPQLKPASYVDLDRYQGVWYEIASLPQVYQQGCTCTEAEYTKLESGDIKVVNSCVRNGTATAIEGKAVVTNAVNQSELLVTFPNSSPGRYVILHIDPQYRYAVVGSDSAAGGLWILSRTRQLDSQSLKEALSKAQQQMNISKLEFTQQSNCD